MIIKDRHFIEYVKRFLKAGVMEQGIPKPSETGTPQGGNMSPVLANIYLHYVLDQWFENNFKKEAEGECYLIRYADDFIMLFEKPTDGETVNIRIKIANKIKTNTEVLAYDLSKTENCYKLFEEVKDQNIDLLANGAGFGLFGNTWETDLDRELEMIDLNIKAVHVLTKLFLSQMMERDSGHILNIASSAGFLSGPILNTYYASKNYVAKWTLALYEELRRTQSNVKISCLCPGPVNTNFNKTAGGSFNLKGLSSEYVAKYGIDNCLKGKLLIVPGVMVRLGLFFNRFVSNKISLKIVYLEN